jgi:cyclic pyranopterin phosphate synthase
LPLVDSFGRTIDYLRVSVTEACNLRCRYCVPVNKNSKNFVNTNAVNDDNNHDEKFLSFNEIMRICSILADLGIKTVKITGGEPLLRTGIVNFIKDLKTIKGIEKTGLTTNGILLDEHIKDLSGAFLDSINISLDAIDIKKFKEITFSDKNININALIEKSLLYPFN